MTDFWHGNHYVGWCCQVGMFVLGLAILISCQQEVRQPEAEEFLKNIRSTEARSPSEEQAGFRVPRGFRIQLFASEPDIAKPLNMAFDSKGRMWIAADGASTITVHWSDSPYNTWSQPITLVSGIKNDDLCAVVALPGRIGVIWSNQNTKRFGFRTHVDGDAPDAWTQDEIPASQSAINAGTGMADDHINVAVAKDGTLYCAAKTGYDTKGYAKLILLVRRPNGAWDDAYTVTEFIGTRPIVLLNEKVGKVKVIFTDMEGGGNILYSESPTSNISFSAPIELFKGFYNYVTSSKNNYENDIVVLVTNEAGSTRMAEGFIGYDQDIVTPLASVNQTNEIKATEIEEQFTIYPNPSSGYSSITLSNRQEGKYQLYLLDSKGAVLSQIREGVNTVGEVNSIQVDNTNLPSGLYFIRYQTETESKTLKYMIKNK